MSPLLDPSSYAVRLASLPFALATIALGLVFAYAAFMRGAPQLRAAMLVMTGGLLPYVAGTGLAVAAPDDHAAIAFFRFGAATVPLAAAGSVTFQLALAEKLIAWRRALVLIIGFAIAFVITAWITPWAIAGVVITPSGLRFFTPGPLVAPAVVYIAVVSLTGFWAVERAIKQATSPQRRRQLRNANVALAVTFCGTVDVLLIYGIGYAPLGWAFTAAGALLALRSILLDDLLRARALDSRAPVGFAAIGLCAAGGWLLATYLLPSLPGWLAAVPAIGLMLAGRVTIALVARLGTARPGGEGPLDRMSAQYASRVYQIAGVPDVARLTAEVLDLGLGAEAVVLVPARDDWSWRTGVGDVLGDDETPDPLLVPWLVERRRPIHRDEIEMLRLADLRPSLERLLAAHRALLLVPLVVRDELIGLLVIRDRATGKALRRAELGLVDAVAERLASALAFVRVAGDVASRAELAREVELAAAVQSAFVPPPELLTFGCAQVIGSWQPNARCGGDWWGGYRLGPGRTLVVIGDVTGSGVAAAMVTAAAKGACDVAVRLMADDFDLAALLRHLDGAVRRVGAGRFHLTCFAALLDEPAGEVRFANAGHVVPYLVRARERESETPSQPPLETTAGGFSRVNLHALVARGNPLGAGAAPVTRTASRSIVAGDLLVWYTDGVVECRDAEGKQFGDRRLQRVLRRLDPTRLDPTTVHELIAAELAAHLGGLPAGDDMTLVVARVQALELAT